MTAVAPETTRPWGGRRVLRLLAGLAVLLLGLVSRRPAVPPADRSPDEPAGAVPIPAADVALPAGVVPPVRASRAPPAL
ncbi:hypothetical protein [Actinoplanes sp. NPDC051851]|uniref:hypothetical protein n=1 Tax=Actinoplanes sp. NPDC051851 TaxID=3154753 RepID=UPI00343EF2C0